MTTITISEILEEATAVLEDVVGVLFLLATVVFLWGIIQYVLARGNEDKIKESKTYMIYGLVGLTVMLAMWAIAGAICNTFFDAGCENAGFFS